MKNHTPIEAAYMEAALMKGIRELTLPSYYDLCKWLGIIEHGWGDPREIKFVVNVLHKMESEKKIIGKYGYYRRGTHSGAGAKKWVIA